MRTISAAQEKGLSSAMGGRARTNYVKVEIDITGAGGWQDVSDWDGRDWLLSTDWGENASAVMADAEIRLQRNHYNLSLVALLATSKLNYPVTAIKVGRGVRISAAVVPYSCPRASVPSALWVLSFVGVIEVVEWAGSEMVLQCRDSSGKLQRAWVRDVGRYPSDSTIRDTASDSASWGGTAVVADETTEWWLKNGCVKVTAGAPNDTATRNLTAAATASTDYMGSCRIKRGSAAPLGSITVVLIDSVSGAGTAQTVSPAETDQWVSIEGLTVTTGAPGPTTIQLQITVANAGDVLYVDDLQLYDVTNGIAMENAIQNLLDDWDPAGGTLNTPVSPAFMMLQWDQDPMPLLDAIRRAAQAKGWEVRQRWDSGSSSFLPTLFAPNRAGASVRTFRAADYYEPDKCSQSIEDVRNVIRVTYVDTDGVPHQLEDEDATSISEFGEELWMEIAEGFTTPISDSTKAQALIDLAKLDLSNPTLEGGLPLRFFPWIELYDVITWAANYQHSSSDLDLSVQGYRHRCSGKSFRTILSVRGVPALGSEHYLQAECRAGHASHRDMVSTEAPVVPTVSHKGSGFVVVDWPKPGQKRWDTTEIHVSTSPGFEPDSTTWFAEMRGTYAVIYLPTGTTYYLRIRHRTGADVVATSPQVSLAL